eukprot:scaffold4450_cov113-Isochrysis_galbana.AAC.4
MGQEGWPEARAVREATVLGRSATKGGEAERRAAAHPAQPGVLGDERGSEALSAHREIPELELHLAWVRVDGGGLEAFGDGRPNWPPGRAHGPVAAQRRGDGGAAAVAGHLVRIIVVVAVPAHPVARPELVTVRGAAHPMAEAEHRDRRRARTGALVAHHLVLEVVVGTGRAEPVPHSHPGRRDVHVLWNLASVARRLVGVVVVVACPAHPVALARVRREAEVRRTLLVLLPHHARRRHAVRRVHALLVAVARVCCGVHGADVSALLLVRMRAHRRPRGEGGVCCEGLGVI